MHTQVIANQRLYTVVKDLTTSFRLLLHGRVEDELTGELLRSPFTVGVDRDDLVAKSVGDGLLAIGGDPELAFSMLATDAYSFDLHVTAPGYREQQRTIPVPAASTFPLPAVTFSLRRQPVRLQGRVTRAAAGHPPIPGAGITVQAGTVLALRTPLSFDHAAGVEVRECVLAPAGGAKQLELPGLAGESSVTLSDRLGLGGGDVLRLGPPESYEFAIIDSLAPQPADPNQPGEVTLRTPLRRSLAAGAEAQRVNPAAAAVAPQLAAAAVAGEAVLTLDNLLAAAAIRIETAAAPEVEYHAVGALTDADGYYSLDGIAGLRATRFVASAAGFDDGEQPWVIDYDNHVNVLDFRLETP